MPPCRPPAASLRLAGPRSAAIAAVVVAAGSAATTLTAASSDALPAAPPAPAPAPTSTAADGPQDLRLERRDRVGTPDAVRQPRPAARAAAAPVVFGDFLSVQVNVDENGMDIVGDAANEPSIAVDPLAPNRMAVGWRQFDTISSNFRQAGYAWSNDGGRTWSEQAIIEPGIFRSDPVLEAAPDGRLYYLSLQVTSSNDFFCDVFVSTDGGRTWPVKTFAFGGDKAWIVVDDTPGPGFGGLYQAWNWFGNPYQPAQVNRSLDGAATMSEPVPYDLGPDARPIFGTCAVGPDGALHVVGRRNNNSGSIRIVRSPEPWALGTGPQFDRVRELPFNGAVVTGTGPNPAGLLGQVEVAIDTSGGPRNGWIYALATVGPFDVVDPLEVRLVRSTDGGDTWSDAVRINDDNPLDARWNWMGTMDVAPNGRIDVVYVESQSFDAPQIGQLRYRSSSDGGETWTPSVAIGPEWDSHVGWPQQNKIGDYYQLRSDLVGADLICSTTYNDGQDVWYVRIGDRDCDGNGVGDAADLADGTLADCDGNGIPDACEIAAGAAADENGDGVPDICFTCSGDLDLDGAVGFTDLAGLLAQWGPCGGACTADLNDDGSVDIVDLLTMLAAWGPCPA